ncbi:MAG: hypothetical protein EAZ43_06855 [Betaproteobacteria bacterium]|nr:MAG: hypothetical protein EAZ43_06855 [Betaproteobacteria bacterium]
MERIWTALKVLWVLPVSVFALPLLPLALAWPLPRAWRARWSINERVLEIESPAISWFLRGPWFRALSGGSGFAAATIGHVIVGRDHHCLASCRVHEHAHVRQCERWGPLFPLAYITAGLSAAIKARSWAAYYWDNPFEVEARNAEQQAAGTLTPQANPPS